MLPDVSQITTTTGFYNWLSLGGRELLRQEHLEGRQRASPKALHSGGEAAAADSPGYKGPDGAELGEFLRGDKDRPFSTKTWQTVQSVLTVDSDVALCRLVYLWKAYRNAHPMVS